MTSGKKSILRTTLLVLPAQIVFRAGEGLLPLLLAYWFGRSNAMDVYFFAAAFFGLAGSLVFSAYTDSPLVPILAEERIARPKELPRLLGSVLLHTWAVGGAVAAIVGALALGWFAFRYEGADFTLAAKMVLPFTVYLVAMATRQLFATLLTVRHFFMVQPIALGLGMVVNIGMLATGHAALGVWLVPIAALAGELVATILLATFAIRIAGERFELGFARPPALVAFGRLVANQVGGGAVTRVNPVVDQLMAGFTMVVGAGTMLRYSSDIAMLPTSLLQAALLPVLLAHLSDDYAARDMAKLRRTVVRALVTVCALLVVASLVLYAARAPLLRFVFLRGEMDAEGVDRMIRIMPYHLVGLPGFGALLVLARAHIAIKNLGIMISMGLLNAGANLVFNVVLLKIIGLEGIALATSFVHTVVPIVFWYRLEARLREEPA
ncbi:MAG: hypothetical protein KF819_08150 [Labilithrix sp.]|nr:hypothetical protein [Labilithrix sp.]